MRKFVLLVIVALLAISGFSTQAAAGEQLTDLASFYDADAVFYASSRTDEAFLGEIDALFERVRPFLPEDELPPAGLTELLNQQLEAEGLESLDESIFPWLGDAAAIGVLPLTLDDMSAMGPDEFPIYATFRIDDRAAADDYFDTVLADDQGATETEEINGFTIYTLPNELDGYLALGDDVLFWASPAIARDDLPFDGFENPLSANNTFIESMGALPADNYNAVFYLASARLQELVYTAAGEQDGFQTEALVNTLRDLSTIVQAQTGGLTILGDNTLALDIVQISNYTVLEDAGFEIRVPGAVDLSFADRVPADAPLVIHSSDFGSQVQNSLDQIENLDQFIEEQGGLNQVIQNLAGEQADSIPPDVSPFIDAFNFTYLLAPVNVTFAGLTGLSLERDILPALDGDVAMFLRIQPAEDFFLSPVLPDFGLLFQSSSDAPVAIVNSIIEASQAYETNYPTEEYGNGSALVINLISQQFNAPQLDLLVGGIDGLLAMGTRSAVEAAADTTDGLSSSDDFQNASANFLADPVQVLYLNSAPLLDVLTTFIEQQGTFVSQEDVETIRLFSIVDTATITGVSSDDARLTIQRATITLNDEPIEIEATESTEAQVIPDVTPTPGS